MNTEARPQDKMKDALQKVGIAYKDIECYGSQIVITSWSRSAAEKWASLLANFATVRKAALESLDYTKVNTKSVMNHSTVRVWRTFATIKEAL